MQLTKIIHEDGWKFILSFAAVAACLMMFSVMLGWIGVILTGWCIYFFRDPQRVTPVGESLVISPADGVIQSITESFPPRELNLDADKPMRRISIFLNVFDVHVNRVPSAGKITQRHYHAGQFLNASFDKASELNERQTFVLESKTGPSIVFVQIAGLIARRIRADIHVDDLVEGGQRFGIIRFGSRMDVYIPLNVAPQVCVGQRAVGGETVLADLSKTGKARDGEIR